MVPLSVAEILELITHASILDTSGEYKLAIGVLARNSLNSSDYSKKTEEKNEITLVSQCSLSRLHLLPELAKRWEGPLSICVFLLPEEVETGIKILLLLRKCVPDLHHKATFSVVYPLGSSHQPTLKLSFENVSCDEISKLFSKFNRSNYDFGTISYPNNLLRNVARKAVKTDYMFIVDVDMIPSEHLRTRFLAYLKANKLSRERQGNLKNEQEKTVWVVPSYEIDVDAHIPDNKSNLLKLREMGKARPFYQELCWKCQKYTEYDAWERRKPRMNEKETDPLQHLYEVLWRDPWEPFYISKTNVPLYDERFRQYGFNRISQSCILVLYDGAIPDRFRRRLATY
ncbi:Beta-1,4-glucuronyltransferase 1 [Armadillidium nasatum]|uniref:Beta-1,4-glucuronyltransferase 1 n=1 Tax=Armadillidium nasatum TaxID=96803 RepID=A0A5N5T817_9CRUS|nr:Beta-1,4-glucuronyltransferase 1 [Armadillidium nasatum]